MGCSNTRIKDYNLINDVGENTILSEYNESTRSNSLSDDISKESEIDLLVEVDESDKNKEIYFLNNIYSNGRQIKNVRNFTEMNEFNTDLHINGKKYNFKKFFIPNGEEKQYRIHLKFQFNFLVNDSSYMFFNCQNIISIDLTDFNASNITNMNNMFYGCKNLRSIKFSMLFILEKLNLWKKCLLIAKIWKTLIFQILIL